MDQQPVEMK